MPRPPADVRSEIASLLNGKAGEAAPPAGNGMRAAKAADLPPAAAKAQKPPAKVAAPAAAKSKPKKR